MNMRQLINLVESFFNDSEENMETDSRVWIDTTGKIHDISDDMTHAEAAYFYHGDYRNIDTDDGDIVDYAFTDLLNRGWIRGFRTADSSLCGGNFDSSRVTKQALDGLIKFASINYADQYYLDDGVNAIGYSDFKLFMSAIRKLRSNAR